MFLYLSFQVLLNRGIKRIIQRCLAENQANFNGYKNLMETGSQQNMERRSFQYFSFWDELMGQDQQQRNFTNQQSFLQGERRFNQPNSESRGFVTQRAVEEYVYQMYSHGEYVYTPLTNRNNKGCHTDIYLNSI